MDLAVLTYATLHRIEFTTSKHSLHPIISWNSYFMMMAECCYRGKCRYGGKSRLSNFPSVISSVAGNLHTWAKCWQKCEFFARSISNICIYDVRKKFCMSGCVWCALLCGNQTICREQSMCTLHLGIFEEDCQVWRIHVCEGGWRGVFRWSKWDHTWLLDRGWNKAKII